MTPKLAVRVNPPFGAQGRGHEDGRRSPSQFGIDHDRVAGARPADRSTAGADWRGLHIFAGSQALHADALIELQRETVALAASICRGGRRTRRREVNLGGGFGIPYFAKDEPLDVEAVGAALAKTLADAPENPRRHQVRDRARPLAGRGGGGLSDPHRRPQGKPRQDLPRHRRRPPPPCSPRAAISASCCAATIPSPSPAASAPSRTRR